MSRVRRRQRPSASRRALIWDDSGVRCVRSSVKRCDSLMADRAGGFTHLRGRTGRSPTSELQSSTTLSRVESGGHYVASLSTPGVRYLVLEGRRLRQNGFTPCWAPPQARHGCAHKARKGNAARGVLQIAGETGEKPLIFELFAVSNPPVAGGVICEWITPRNRLDA